MWTSSIEWLERSGGFILPILQKQILFSTILFVLVFILTGLMRKQSPLLHLGLWTMVLIRLVVPTDLSLPISARNLVTDMYKSMSRPRISAAQSTVSNPSLPTYDIQGDSQSRLASPVTIERPDKHNIPWKSILFGGWMAGVWTLLAFYVKRLADYHRLVRNSKSVSDHDKLELAERWKSLYRIRRPIRLVTSDEFLSPFTIGIVRPIIYLPWTIAKTENATLAEAVISHELAHVRCYDALWMRLQNLIQIVYFFHPVVWFTSSRIHLLKECICDSLVISKRKLSIETYGLGLLSVLKWNVFGTDEIGILPGFGSPRKKIMQRIFNIKRQRRFGKRHLALILGLMVVMVIFILPMAKRPLQPKNDRTENLSMNLAEMEQSLADYVKRIRSIDPSFARKTEMMKRMIRSYPSIYPVQNGKEVSPFGERQDPITGSIADHRGVDYAIPRGTPVVATADGKVLIAENQYVKGKGEGRHILIEHLSGLLQTRYTQLDTVLVKKGQKVKRWDVIGRVGATGRATGPHLHYEVWKDGEPVNPENYILNFFPDAMPYINPVRHGIMFALFGKRPDYPTVSTNDHLGIDLTVPKGTPVVATADGWVLIAENNGVKSKGEGRHIIIDHQNGFQTKYTQLDTVFIKQGQQVKQWDVIGRVGAAGSATGPHSHYEIWENGKPVNPYGYMLNSFPIP